VFVVLGLLLEGVGCRRLLFWFKEFSRILWFEGFEGFEGLEGFEGFVEFGELRVLLLIILGLGCV